MSYRSFVLFAILLPFVAYNTAAADVFSPRIAFSDKAQSFLSVYSIRYTDNDGIYGVIIDRRGREFPQFEIYRGSVMDVRIAYLASMDRYLVVFISTPDNYTHSLMGRLISSDGNPISDTFQITSNQLGIGGFEVITDASQSGFLIVWLDYNRSLPSMYGRFVDPDGTLIEKEIEILKSADSVVSFDIAADPDNKRYFAVYSVRDGNKISIEAHLLDSSLTSTETNKIGMSGDIACQISASYNSVDKSFFVAFTDYVVGANYYYQIKGILVGGNSAVSPFPLATEESFSNRSPEVIFNGHNNLFSVVYQSENLTTNTSNIIVKDVNSDGKIVTEYKVDSSDTSYLVSPSIASSNLCGNEVVVYIDSDRQSAKNNYASMLIGGLCRFLLSVSKKGDGEGSIISNPPGIDCGSSCNSIFEDGKKVTLSADPDEGSVFIGYTGAGCGVDQTCYLTVDSDSSLQAEFMLKRFTINTLSGAGGRIEPEDPVVKYGESQTFYILSDLGYVIEDVKVDNLSVGAVDTYTFTRVTSSHSISATFRQERVYYTISATASIGGTITPAGDLQIAEGASITFLISPLNGYYLDDVMVDGESVGRKYEYTFENVSQDHTISVSFKPYLDKRGSTKTIVKEGPSSAGCGCTMLK